MKRILKKLKGLSLLSVVYGFVLSAGAAPLAGQAGADTVARAQAPQGVVKPRAADDAKPPEEAPKANPKDAIKVGVIERLSLVGELKFIQEEDVAGLLRERICDGAEKTVGDLRGAFAAVKQTLAARGFYVVYIYPSSANAYHEDTRTLDLTVDPVRFGKVNITRAEEAGNWYSDEQIAKRFKFVKPGEPFNYRTLRQAIRSVNAHPDMMADTKLLSRLAETNEVTAESRAEIEEDADAPDVPTVLPTTRYIDTELTVDDSFPLHATLDLNNYAMPELNYWQMLLAVQYLNLTGADDVLSVSPGWTMNGKMWSIAASYVRPFDILRGGSWSVYGGYSDMNCDGVTGSTDLLGLGGFAGLNTSWNLYDDAKRSVAFNLGLMWRMIVDRWTVQGVNLARRDIHIVPLTFGFSYGEKQRDWLGGLDFASVSQTVNLYGDKALFNSYSEDANPNYWILRANWSRLQPLYGPSQDGEEWRCWSLFTKVEGQWSEGTTLITAERLAYGGNACLRGYRRYGYLGDSGIYGTAEFRTPVWCNPVSKYFLPEDWTMALERIQLFLFTDAGYIAYNTTTTAGMEQEEFLWSAGFGVRAALTQYLSLNFDCAFPLRTCYADDLDRDLELYFSIKLQY